MKTTSIHFQNVAGTKIMLTINAFWQQVKLKLKWTHGWVKWHKDETQPDETLSQIKCLNVIMDNLAEDAYGLEAVWLRNVTVPVLLGEYWAAYLGDKMLTTNMKWEVIKHYHPVDLWQYMQAQHGVTDQQFKVIMLTGLKCSLKNLSYKKQVTMIKLIHGWLPIQTKLHQQGQEESQTYPRWCQALDKTQQHVFCCNHDEAMKQRQHVWAITDKTMCKCGTAPELLNGTKSGHNFTSLPGFKPIHWLGMMQGENHGWSQWEDGKMNWDGTSFRKESQRMDRHQGTLWMVLPIKIEMINEYMVNCNLREPATLRCPVLER